MTNDEVLHASRLRVLAASRALGSVAAACKVHGIHRSTFYRWKDASAAADVQRRSSSSLKGSPVA
jgi:ACT domain-containing protein